MRIKTQELSVAALDWAVLSIEDSGWAEEVRANREKGRNISASERSICYSTGWGAGGAIIEREGISLEMFPSATRGNGEALWRSHVYGRGVVAFGPTPLVAAMRRYVLGRLGEEVEIPDEILRRP